MQRYNFVIRLLFPIVVFYTFFKFLSAKTGIRFLSQKFSFYNYAKALSAANLKNRPIIIHCASIGEVMSVDCLIEKLSKHHSIIITTNTITSYKFVKKLIEDSHINALHFYMPWDYKILVKKFIQAITPQCVLIVETEIWPNLYNIINKNNIPLVIVNGRITAKTLNPPFAKNWLNCIFKNILDKCDYIMAKDEASYKNFLELGVRAEKIKVFGNLKFSKKEKLSRYMHCHEIPSPFVILASSREGDEVAFLQQWFKITKKIRERRIAIIAPRHIKRSKQITQSLLNSSKINLKKDELAIFSKNDAITDKVAVYLFDAFGYMHDLYRQADLVVMGGSWHHHGGHNILEPAIESCPIIVGPDLKDFKEELDYFLEHDAIVQIKSMKNLATQMRKCLENNKKSKSLGKNANTIIKQQQEVLPNYLNFLEDNFLKN